MTDSMLQVGVLSAAHGHAAGYLRHLAAQPNVAVSFSDPGAPDDVADRGQQLAAAAGARWIEDPAELLAGADAVVVCSENSRHHDDVLAALGQGCHVLCEKPMATTAADAVHLWQAANGAGLVLGVAHPVRQSPAYRHLQARLEGGALGTVLSLLGTNNGMLPRDRAWFTQPQWSGGGALADHLVHCTDLVDGLLGAAAVRVRAASNRILEQYPPTEVETGGIVTIEYEGGVIATVDCSWSQPRTAPTWGGLSLDVIGTRGRVRIDPFNLRVAGFAAGGPQWLAYGSDMDADMIGNFLSAVRGRTSIHAGALAGVRSVEIMAAALESAREGGRTVAVRSLTSTLS
ncbi:Gfo/Idh/MocA family protein [Angustibacter luteus]|uniref:Gfo/Idh/MocA family protein n=1 Tax=Angustibacter luteus TaxID=658456 RepID=A0ABW1J9K7_9ACTN